MDYLVHDFIQGMAEQVYHDEEFCYPDIATATRVAQNRLTDEPNSWRFKMWIDSEPYAELVEFVSESRRPKGVELGALPETRLCGDVITKRIMLA